MKKMLFCFVVIICSIGLSAQQVALRIQEAFRAFENDSQLRNSITSLYVVYANNGKVIFDKNSTIGLPAASTQKIITAASMYEMFGKEFRYQTQFAIEKLKDRSILHIIPSGDPTLGSWRWKSTKENELMKRVITSLRSIKDDPITDI